MQVVRPSVRTCNLRRSDPLFCCRELKTLSHVPCGATPSFSETSRHSLALDAVDTVFQQQPCRLTYLHKNMEEDAAMHRFPRPLVLCACVHVVKILLPPLATAGCGEERMKVALYYYYALETGE